MILEPSSFHYDVIKWKHFPRNWPFVRGIHRSPVNSPHKGQWRGALMFSLICVWINGWVNNREAGDLRRYRGHYDVIVTWGRTGTNSLSQLMATYLIDAYKHHAAFMGKPLLQLVPRIEHLPPACCCYLKRSSDSLLIQAFWVFQYIYTSK